MLDADTIPDFPEELDGEEGRHSMELDSLFAITPPIRSSDYDLVCRAPFCYFLSRRLGLVKALRWSAALSRGSWFHEAFKHMNLTPHDRRAKVELSLELRQEELSGVCSQLGIPAESRREILLRERQDVESTIAWYEAASHTPISEEYGSFLQFLNRPYWQVLSRECRLVSTVPWRLARTIQVVAQPDLLLYHKGQNSVWIVDAKTTSYSPSLRASSCPFEFQTHHYLHIANRLLDRGVIQRTFNLPTDARLGGMIHLIVKKPSIEFGMKDRNFTVDTTPFKSGPRKGLPKNEKVYFGDPVWENYLSRVQHWYLATDEYENNKPEWAIDPPVNMSIVSGSIVNDPYQSEQYLSQLRLVKMWAARKPEPQFFPHPSSLIHFGKLDDYAPFVMNPPSAWSEIIKQEGWMQIRRDDIPADVDFDVIQEPGSEFD
jgi:hypothetical protein